MSSILDYLNLPTRNQQKVNNSKKNNIQIKKRLNQFKLPTNMVLKFFKSQMTIPMPRKKKNDNPFKPKNKNKKTKQKDEARKSDCLFESNVNKKCERAL